MIFTIEFFRIRKTDNAHATLDRITHMAPDLESAKVKARSLFGRQFGAIRTEPGNLRLRRTAWWGWEDSNFQPNDYPPLELNH
jgi:hypothetical protein